MNGFKATLGIIAGTVAGLSIGMLFAPDKGSRTRRELRKNGKRFAEDIGDRILDLNDEMKTKMKSARKETEELAHKGSELAEEVTN
ncbi:MAG: YtxH domain-containing protein [Bacteroidota bacterium]